MFIIEFKLKINMPFQSIDFFMHNSDACHESFPPYKCCIKNVKWPSIRYSLYSQMNLISGASPEAYYRMYAGKSIL